MKRTFLMKRRNAAQPTRATDNAYAIREVESGAWWVIGAHGNSLFMRSYHLAQAKLYVSKEAARDDLAQLRSRTNFDDKVEIIHITTSPLDGEKVQ